MLRTAKLVKSEKGMTLIEILVSLVILGILTVSIMEVHKVIVTSQTNELKNHQVRQIYQEATVLLTKDVKEAKEIIIDNQPTYDKMLLYKVNGSTVTLRYQKDDEVLLYNGQKWFSAKPMTSGGNVIEYDPVQNTVAFHLLIEQKNKPSLPLDFVVAPRYKNVE